MKFIFKNLLSPFLSHPAWAGGSVLITLGIGLYQVILPSDNESDTANKENVAFTKNGNWIEPTTGMEFVWVSGGCFDMGQTKTEKEELKNVINDKPWHTALTKNNFRHKVCVDGLWVGKYEVSQKEWKKIFGSINPSGNLNFGYQIPEEVNTPELQQKYAEKVKNEIVKSLDKGDSYPVAGVWYGSLYDSAKDEEYTALNFISKLNDKNKDQFFFRLPTEAEWEYVCRSGGKPNEVYSGGKNLDSLGWYKDNSFTDLHRIGLKAPNALGIYDMSGGVSEWVIDTCDGDSYLKHGYKNPVLVSDGSCQGIRGGGYSNKSYVTRCTMRWGSESGSPNTDNGFRVVRIPK